MRNMQAIAQQDETEEALVAWLKAKSPEGLRQFLATAWVVSLLSPEAIEKLYHELQQQEAAWREGREEDLIEVVLD